MSAVVSRSKPYVRPATKEDCIDLAPRLREEDLEEIAHTWGLDSLRSILIGFHTSETYAVIWGTEVVALFGCRGIPGVIGIPWMVASPTLSKIRKSFLRECRGFVQFMLLYYGQLENHVWAGNKVHIKWLEWLGFTLDPPEPYGINDEPFHRFYMKNNNV